MKIDLKYFSGTGNSWKVLDTCREAFQKKNHIVSIAPIDENQIDFSLADLIGFCFPVYAFSIPRICRKYLKEIPAFKDPQNVFILITAGDIDEPGYAVQECEMLLKKKNVRIVYSKVIEMPVNWTVEMNPPSTKEAENKINMGILIAKQIAEDILKGTKVFHQFHIPKRGRWTFYKEYFLFRYLGLANLWRTFKVNAACNGCQLCSLSCPANAIRMIENRPKWNALCEQCMRCVNYCPNKAILQGKDISSFNRYHVPDFKPTKTIGTL
jgi:ferredoxin